MGTFRHLIMIPLDLVKLDFKISTSHLCSVSLSSNSLQQAKAGYASPIARPFTSVLGNNHTAPKSPRGRPRGPRRAVTTQKYVHPHGHR